MTSAIMKPPVITHWSIILIPQKSVGDKIWCVVGRECFCHGGWESEILNSRPTWDLTLSGWGGPPDYPTVPKCSSRSPGRQTRYHTITWEMAVSAKDLRVPAVLVQAVLQLLEQEGHKPLSTRVKTLHLYKSPYFCKSLEMTTGYHSHP